MIRVMRSLLPIFLLSMGSISLIAQEGGEQSVDERMIAREDGFEELLEQALSAAENSDWERALGLLDEAEAYHPDDPRIASYRSSFFELAALDDAQKSWNDGSPSEVKVEQAGTPEDGAVDESPDSPEEKEPKFTIDRGDRDPRESPILTRDQMRAELAVKFFSSDPIKSEVVNTWSSSDEFFYASLGADFAYWMPFLRHSLGVNFRSSGYSFRPGDPAYILNSLDLGLNIRGFLLESKTSRLELGLDFGGSLQSSIDTNLGPEKNWALFLGIWASDPLFFHIFNADNLENLLFGGGIRIYSSFSDEIAEMVNYRLDGLWKFQGVHLGVRFDWWDFNYSGTRMNMLSFSLIGGFRF